MKKILTALVLLFFGIATSQAQNEPKYGIEFSGFVKTDLIRDSRQTISIREGHFLLYPAPEIPDANGSDINAVPNFNFLSIQTRLHGKITGPDAFGAKTSGAIEGEFFGHSDGDINGFRLRHAFAKLSWTSTELMVGQYWHPLFATNCFPDVVSFNTGAPFIAFSRNPQVRLTQKFDGFKVSLTALSQRDFTSNGPGGASSKFLRNSGLPAMNLLLEYEFKNEDKGTSFQLGVAGNYKILKPRITTSPPDFPGIYYATSTTIGSFAYMGYAKAKLPEVTIKAGGFYAEDAFNLTMLGGYAEEKIVNVNTGELSYTPFKTISAWGDFHTNGKTVQAGLFIGYSENLGAVETFAGTAYVRGSDIDYLYRISPRIIYNAGKFRVAPEIEYTVAAYATRNEVSKALNINSKGQVTESKEVSLIRLLIGIYYFF